MTITPATHAISINPATGEQLSVLPWAGADDIENALQLRRQQAFATGARQI